MTKYIVTDQYQQLHIDQAKVAQWIYAIENTQMQLPEYDTLLVSLPYSAEMATRAKPADAAELLEKVADRFESEALIWIQGKLGMPQQTACLVGGVSFTSTNAQVEQLAYKALWEAIDKVSHLPAWNDQPGRTKEEVIDLLRRAAKDLRNVANAD